MSHPGEWIGRVVLLALVLAIGWFTVERMPSGFGTGTKPLIYDKGRYLGSPDTPVPADAAQTLGERVGEQAF